MLTPEMWKRNPGCAPNSRSFECCKARTGWDRAAAGTSWWRRRAVRSSRASMTIPIHWIPTISPGYRKYSHDALTQPLSQARSYIGVSPFPARRQRSVRQSCSSAAALRIGVAFFWSVEATYLLPWRMEWKRWISRSDLPVGVETSTSRLGFEFFTIPTSPTMEVLRSLRHRSPIWLYSSISATLQATGPTVHCRSSTEFCGL